MTQEEIKKKAYEAYPEANAISPDGYPIDNNLQYRSGYIRALAEAEELPKVRGWVARDAYKDVENGVGLILHSSKPDRGNEEWTAGTIMAHLPWDMFPDLKWKDEPIEVELLIRPL